MVRAELVLVLLENWNRVSISFFGVISFGIHILSEAVSRQAEQSRQAGIPFLFWVF